MLIRYIGLQYQVPARQIFDSEEAMLARGELKVPVNYSS